VRGEDWFDRLESSPAWRLIGYGAIAGFSTRQPYAALVRNRHPRSKYLAHALICDPARGRVYELFRRTSDQAWLERTYAPVNEGLVDDAGKFGPEALVQSSASRTPFKPAAESGLVGALLNEVLTGRQRAR
jgi:hypothetical protein